jgi:hypothetical protein
MSKWAVPILSQKTGALCWEACARMVWHWKHGSMQGYKAAAGRFLKRQDGLPQSEMDVFYKALGMRSIAHPGASDLQRALGRSPAIFTSIEKAAGHAMVAAGFVGGIYQIIDPCFEAVVTFNEDGSDSMVCTGGTTPRPAVAVEGPLGVFIWHW